MLGPSQPACQGSMGVVETATRTLPAVDRRAWLLTVVGALIVVAAGTLMAMPRAPRAALRPADPDVSPPPRMAVDDLYAAFASSTTGTSSRTAVWISVEDAGTVVLPSGRLVASDAFVIFDAVPFTIALPAGRHPVSVLRVDFVGGDRRVAAAMVRFGPNDPVRWEPALVAGQDPATLGPDEFFGYGVDAGTGAFTSPEAAERLRDEAAYDTYSKAVMAAMFPGGEQFRLTAQVEVDDAGGANVVAFASGFGDGAYPTFVGIDRNGRPAVVLTDFGILDAPGP
jgi:uncharacterized protein DUF4241